MAGFVVVGGQCGKQHRKTCVFNRSGGGLAEGLNCQKTAGISEER